MDLTERKKRILRAVIESYIQNAEPVGSRTVAEWANLEVSSATIRNEMADLEQLGYLEQPHTSAGRVPSPKGYRLYVNELMEDYKLSVQETERINQALQKRMKALDRVIDEAGRLVAKLTQYPAFTLSAGPDRITIRRFDLLFVEQNAFIAVVMTDSNVVRNQFFQIASDLSPSQLQMLGTLLNSSFTGRTLAELGPELTRISQHAAGDAFELIELVVHFGMEVLSDLEQRRVHTVGIANLLEHREYQSLEKALPLMSFLSEEEYLSFPVDPNVPTDILIGPENVAEALKHSSVIVASCDLGNGTRGVIGVVGPTRMDYAKLSARLTYLARGLGWLMTHGSLPSGEEEPT